MPEQQQAAGEEHGGAAGSSVGESRATGNDGTSGAPLRASNDTPTGGTAARPRPTAPAATPVSGPNTTVETPDGATAGAAGAATGAAGAGTTTDSDSDTAATPASARRGRWRALTLAGGSGGGQAEGATATASAGSGDNSPDAGMDTPGGPKKPMLAGAALVGTILIAVPLLIMAATNDRDRDRGSDKVAQAGSSDTLLDSGDAPPGAFVAESPSSKKTTKEPQKRTGAKKESPVQNGAPGTHAPSPHNSPAKTTPKQTTQNKVARTPPPSNLPSALTRVLIKNNTNSTCVDLPGFSNGMSEGRVVQSTCNSNADDNQLWNLEEQYRNAGPGGATLFLIRNIKDRMCLNLPGYTGVGGGTKVTEYPCSNSTADNQLWWLDQQPDGKYWIRNLASDNQCLDSYSADSTTRDLIVWPCAPERENNHEWFTTPH